MSKCLIILSLIALGCDRQAVPAPQRAVLDRGSSSHASQAHDPWQMVSQSPQASSDPIPRERRTDDWFDEISGASQINFTYRNGREGEKYTLMESVGGGTAIFDFDNDEWADVFFVGGGTIQGSPIVVGGLPNALFRNLGGLHFAETSKLAAVSTSPNYTLGCSVCDFNCDGQLDLFVAGYPRSRLYCNQGDGTFTDVTGLAALSHEGLHTASAWGDFDNDGLPDLFVSGYVTFDLREDRSCGEDLRRIRDICGIWQYPPAPDRLYHNQGDGTFDEQTVAAGLRNDGRGLGALATDVNEDGMLDLYIANDYTPNFLYVGDGTGKFTERGLESGTAVDAAGTPQGSMGVDIGDFDGDGRGDIFVTNYQLEDNILYKNLGDTLFTVAGHVGLQDICRPYVGFGTGWVDFDGDGWLDLFVLNGHVMYHTGQSPYAQPQFLFRNSGGMRFENTSDKGGPYFSIPHVARGGAVGDLDNDGAADLVVVHQNSPVTVLRNRIPSKHWVSLCLRGIESDPLAVGAVVKANFSGRELVRSVRGGAGYLSHFDRRILLPVDNEKPTQCVVRWLNGSEEVFSDLQVDRSHTIVQGRGSPANR